ncbi:hypothetical protein PpBr36_04683 [Pyricularia pennisetigena]|uniref:hypothetical protein n=1 Tax=Pyricularia pennisetigena TaxID=1578925 RepID=UPI00114E8E29|nr:hypothetical protein PpBr36_04683 [Pyricularia pennisetigena]TLS27337.1 hypothetical protein PpBr36_04683 [Pyricularia pennisetigena]
MEPRQSTVLENEMATAPHPVQPTSEPITPRPSTTMEPVAAVSNGSDSTLSDPASTVLPGSTVGIQGENSPNPDSTASHPIVATKAGSAHDSMVTVRLSGPESPLTVDTSVGSSHPVIARKSIATHEPGSINSMAETADYGKVTVEGIELVTENSTAGPNLADELAAAAEDNKSNTAVAESESSSIESDDAVTPTPESNRESTKNRSASPPPDPEDVVNWESLQKREDEQLNEETADNTALLLARLEQENAKLATNPKSAKARLIDNKRKSRPPSMAQLRNMVTGPTPSALRYSMLPPPPMTDLEFYAALVKDYEQTAARLPTLLSHKIRKGIPPPLRGVVWTSMSGARDVALEEQFEYLSGESSPFECIISKDLGRSFPGVDMFREADGEGQRMLGRVLKCYSIYDPEIGYCQGLAFLVGPLLMHMPDKQAFCVLVRLMENYDLRSCFLPDLSGLHVRIWQFNQLIHEHLPVLSNHLDDLQVDPVYVSQWFLSFFGTAAPLPFLFRIYDVLFAEGSTETLLRVALSLMRKNERRLLACTELDGVLALCLSRGLWDCYNYNADEFIQDVVSLSDIVNRERLVALEQAYYRESTQLRLGSPNAARQTSDVSTAASRFLGRFTSSISSGPTSSKSQSQPPAVPTPSSISSSSTITPTTNSLTTPPSHVASFAASTAASSVTNSPGLAAPSRPTSMLRRSTSKQSLASTLNSMEANSTSTSSSSAVSVLSSASTEATSISRDSHVPQQSQQSAAKGGTADDRYIEELLLSLSDLQRQQVLLAEQLQREREDREEDRQAIKKLLHGLQENGTVQDSASPDADSSESETGQLAALVSSVESRFSDDTETSASLIVETKTELRDQLARTKEQLNNELAKSQDQSRREADLQQEISSLKDQLRASQSHVRTAFQDKQRLEKQIHSMRARASAAENTSSSDQTTIGGAIGGATEWFGRATGTGAGAAGGLRELKLGRSLSTPSQASQAGSGSPPSLKRASSIFTTASVRGAGSRESLVPLPTSAPSSEHEALLLELVQAKTAEAIARQEADEAKQKLKTLRESLGLGPADSLPGAQLNSGAAGGASAAASAAMGMFGRLTTTIAETASAKTGATPAPAAPAAPTPVSTPPAGGFWGWRRG